MVMILANGQRLKSVRREPRTRGKVFVAKDRDNEYLILSQAGPKLVSLINNLAVYGIDRVSQNGLYSVARIPGGAWTKGRWRIFKYPLEECVERFNAEVGSCKHSLICGTDARYTLTDENLGM